MVSKLPFHEVLLRAGVLSSVPISIAAVFRWLVIMMRRVSVGTTVIYV